MTTPRRIAIVGNSGSGKSRLATQIASATGLPLVHLDRHFWLPGWVQRSREEFGALHAGFVAGDAWVIDGNFARTLPLRAQAADLVVFFNLPLWLCLWRIAWRVITSLGRVRPDMAPGCPERVDLSFIAYVWAWKQRRRAETIAAIETANAARKTIVVSRQRDLAKVWQALGKAPSG